MSTRVTMRVMDGTWTLGVLPVGMEIVQPVAGGEESTVDDAVLAACDALVAVAGRCGRQEYRLAVGDTRMIVVPGLTDEGQVDMDELRGAVLSTAIEVDRERGEES